MVSFFLPCYCRQLLSLPQILFLLYIAVTVPGGCQIGSHKELKLCSWKTGIAGAYQQWHLLMQPNTTSAELPRKPGKQRDLFLCILWSTARKLQQAVSGTGESSATGLLEVFRQSTSWLLISVPPLSRGENDNSVCCRSISALACYSDVGLYYLVQKSQLIPAVTALLCRQPNYKKLIRRKIKWDLVENKVSQQNCSATAAQIKV